VKTGLKAFLNESGDIGLPSNWRLLIMRKLMEIEKLPENSMYQRQMSEIGESRKLF